MCTLKLGVLQKEPVLSQIPTPLEYYICHFFFSCHLCGDLPSLGIQSEHSVDSNLYSGYHHCQFDGSDVHMEYFSKCRLACQSCNGMYDDLGVNV